MALSKAEKVYIEKLQEDVLVAKALHDVPDAARSARTW